jgi:probable HAF family extracellular repeat protein
MRRNLVELAFVALLSGIVIDAWGDSPYVLTDLGKVGVGNSNLAMNAAGQVIGSGVASGVQRAFFFDGTLRDLTLGGTSGEISHAFALNNLGQVVGGAYTASGQYHAFLYSNGTTTDLNTFAPAGSGYTLSTASAINDAGTILCTGTDPNGAAVFLLVTVPEPSTSALVVAGAIGLLACVWQRKPAK